MNFSTDLDPVLSKSRLNILDESQEFVPQCWGDTYVHERHHWGERLLCSTDGNKIEFFIRLFSRIPGPYIFTYVLEDNAPSPEYQVGRYVSETLLTLDQVIYFLHEFEDFFVGDARHHLQVSSSVVKEMVIFDHHDYFYFYGDVNSLVNELRSERFRERENFSINIHQHVMSMGSAPLQRMMEFWHWTRYELEITDTRRNRTGFWKYSWMKVKAVIRDLRHRFGK